MLDRTQSDQRISEVSYLVAYREFIMEIMVGFHTERAQSAWTKESTISGQPTFRVGQLSGKHS